MHSLGRAMENQIPTVGLHAHLSCSTMLKQGTAEGIWNRIVAFLIRAKQTSNALESYTPHIQALKSFLNPSQRQLQQKVTLCGIAATLTFIKTIWDLANPIL